MGGQEGKYKLRYLLNQLPDHKNSGAFFLDTQKNLWLNAHREGNEVTCINFVGIPGAYRCSKYIVKPDRI